MVTARDTYSPESIGFEVAEGDCPLKEGGTERSTEISLLESCQKGHQPLFKPELK